MISRTDGKWASEGTLILLDYRYEAVPLLSATTAICSCTIIHRGETWMCGARRSTKKAPCLLACSCPMRPGAKYPSAAYGGDTLWLSGMSLTNYRKPGASSYGEDKQRMATAREELPGTTASQKSLFPALMLTADCAFPGGAGRTEIPEIRQRMERAGRYLPDDGGKEPV